MNHFIAGTASAEAQTHRHATLSTCRYSDTPFIYHDCYKAPDAIPMLRQVRIKLLGFIRKLVLGSSLLTIRSTLRKTSISRQPC
jgi:hypothetical protein